MRLLYCQNNLVVGIHEDTANVALSVYATGTRIIPYDQTLDTLSRFGTLPPSSSLMPNPPDTRPYQQPPETQHILIMYASQCRYNYITGGMSYTALDSSVIPVKTDRTSQNLFSNLAQYAATQPPTTPIDFTQDGVHYPITAQDVVNINTQFQVMSQKYRTTEAACLADLNSASPTIALYDDVDQRFASA